METEFAGCLCEWRVKEWRGLFKSITRAPACDVIPSCEKWTKNCLVRHGPHISRASYFLPATGQFNCNRRLKHLVRIHVRVYCWISWTPSYIVITASFSVSPFILIVSLSFPSLSLFDSWSNSSIFANPYVSQSRALGLFPCRGAAVRPEMQISFHCSKETKLKYRFLGHCAFVIPYNFAHRQVA